MPTDADAPALCEVCRKLDGLPLALELAAAQVDTFGVQGLAQGLNDRFALLIKGRRTAAERQQTLHATLDWSHDLLPQIERTVLRRLAVSWRLYDGCGRRRRLRRTDFRIRGDRERRNPCGEITGCD